MLLIKSLFIYSVKPLLCFPPFFSFGSPPPGKTLSLHLIHPSLPHCTSATRLRLLPTPLFWKLWVVSNFSYVGKATAYCVWGLDCGSKCLHTCEEQFEYLSHRQPNLQHSWCFRNLFLIMTNQTYIFHCLESGICFILFLCSITKEWFDLTDYNDLWEFSVPGNTTLTSCHWGECAGYSYVK